MLASNSLLFPSGTTGRSDWPSPTSQDKQAHTNIQSIHMLACRKAYTQQRESEGREQREGGEKEREGREGRE